MKIICNGFINSVLWFIFLVVFLIRKKAKQIYNKYWKFQLTAFLDLS